MFVFLTQEKDVAAYLSILCYSALICISNSNPFYLIPSKRSLYLVIWRMTDGVKGLNEIYQWLINIQARAPNSPCIIVGTHYDEIEQKRSIFGNK